MITKPAGEGETRWGVTCWVTDETDAAPVGAPVGAPVLCSTGVLETPLSWLPLVALGVAVVGLIAGGWLTVVGLRGRRVGDHPHCRRCGFDLHGLPAEGLICPECGARVGGPVRLIGRRVHLGRRERRRRPLRWGLALGLPAMLGLGLLVAAAAGGWSYYRAAPTGALAWQAELGPSTAGPAAAELARRVGTGQL